jgi:amidase
MDDLAFSHATTLAAKIRNKEISAVELLDHYLKRVEKYNPEINSIICLRQEHAKARAEEADAALAAGKNWGPLHGVPMTVKESYDIEGLPSTWGNPEWSKNIAEKDAVSCARLQDAGAIIFGKTNVPIFLADFQSYNEVYGTTNNPHDLTKGPGGSSGGSAAAMAAGLSGLEMGSDIGGSIRNPAHYCGVFGLKPTWNILPMRGHAPAGVLSPTDISVIGPLARSAEDLELVTNIVGGSDDLHNPGWTLALPKPRQKKLSEFRVAVWLNDEIAPVDDSVAERVEKVARFASAAGAKVDYEARPNFDLADSHSTYENLLHAAMSARQPDAAFAENLQRRESLADNDVGDRARVVRASTQYYRDWHAHNERRTHLRGLWHEVFKDYDVLLTPICSTPAFTHDQNPKISARKLQVNNSPRRYMEQIFWAGLTGVSYLPSTLLPTGPNKEGLPIGVQVAGAEMADLTTIEFSRLVHEEMGGFVPAPNYI